MNQEETPATDELTQRRRAAALAQATAYTCYEMARRLQEMGALGMSFSDVAEAVWANLRPDDQESMEQTSFGEFFGFVLDMTTSTFMRIEGETDADRLKRQASYFGTLTKGIAPEFSAVAGKLEKAVDNIGVANKPTTRMRTRIRRLLAEAAAPEGQTAAVECAVCFNGGFTITGSLSEAPDGGLKMLSPNGRDENGNAMFVEQFFDYEDIVVFGIRRAIAVGPRIIRS